MSNSLIEEAIKEICSELNCEKCPAIIKEPKLLPCFHIFSKSPCLEELATLDPEGKTLTCPACQHHVTLPDNGVAGLPTDLQKQHLLKQKEALEKAKNPICGNCKRQPVTKYCQDCDKYICDECREMHQTWEAFSSHILLEMDQVKADTRKVLDQVKQVLKCKQHPDKELRIYCVTCSELICDNCIVRTHKDHDKSVLNDMPEMHKEFENDLEPLKGKLLKVEEALIDLKERDKAITTKRDAVEASIISKIEELKDLLDKRQEELIADLNELTEQKHQQIAGHTREVEITQAKMSSCLKYAENGLKSEFQSEVFRIKAPVLSRIEEITEEFDPASLELRTEDDIELVSDDQASKVCKEFGEVACDPVSAESSYATMLGTKFAMQDTETKVEVHPVTKRGKKSEQKFRLKAKLIYLKNKATYKCDVGQENGSPTITYQPVSRGRHHLHVKMNGKHIKGSPFSIAVISAPDVLLHNPSKVIRGWNEPYGVAVNSKGEIIIAGQNGNCVSVLNMRGERRVTFGDDMLSRGYLNCPFGVAVDNEDNIYVIDNDKQPRLLISNDRILKFNSNGVFVAIAGCTGDGNLQFNHPVGICFNKTDHCLYICDQNNHRIQVLTTDLTFVRAFGKKGQENGQFDCPRDLAFDSDNNLYVTDSKNNRVQVFTAEGEFLKAFSEKTNGKTLQRPNMIALDSSDIVYVSEIGQQCVSIFTPQGEFFTAFGQYGSGEGQFIGVSGLCVDHQDRVLVTDCHTSRLQIF